MARTTKRIVKTPKTMERIKPASAKPSPDSPDVRI